MDMGDIIIEQSSGGSSTSELLDTAKGKQIINIVRVEEYETRENIIDGGVFASRRNKSYLPPRVFYIS